MNEDDMLELIESAILDSDADVREIMSFEDAGILTSDEGIVVAMMNGVDFNITIQGVGG